MNEYLEALLERFQERWSEQLNPIGTPAFLGSSLFIAVVLLLAATQEQGWVRILDDLNLIFHEAGHPIFGLLGIQQLTALGGTLMQHLVPLMVAASAWWKKSPAGVGLALAWYFQNHFGTATYIQDARPQVLDLVGGGEHDWAYLLGEWGLLRQDFTIGLWLRRLGWLGIFGSWAWLAWRWWKDREARAWSPE